MRRQRQKSSNQKNTNQYNENELKESKKDETKNETEAMKEDIIEDVENENATVPRIDNPSFSNSLINIGSIPRSLTKKISKSLFHLVIFQDANELLDALPFVSFPKVHLHPEDIAQAVKLMTKLQQLDTTTVLFSLFFSFSVSLVFVQPTNQISFFVVCCSIKQKHWI
jgi:hypothetical protein